MFEIALLTVFTISLLVFANSKFKISYRIREYFYGRKIDETAEWKSFTQAFEDHK